MIIGSRVFLEDLYGRPIIIVRYGGRLDNTKGNNVYKATEEKRPTLSKLETVLVCVLRIELVELVML